MGKGKRKANGTATDAQIATLAQQAMKPPTLPDPEDASITDRIRMNDEAAKKRMGRAATLAGGAYGPAKTTVKTLAGGY